MKNTIDHSKPTLAYFDVYGKGEAIRFLLSHAKADYNDVRVPSADFQRWKADGSLPAGQLPVWIDKDDSNTSVVECKSHIHNIGARNIWQTFLIHIAAYNFTSVCISQET